LVTIRFGRIGAGDVNRTRFIGLEARGLTIRRRPHTTELAERIELSSMSATSALGTQDRPALSRTPESNRPRRPYRGRPPPWPCGEVEPPRIALGLRRCERRR